MPNRSEPDRSAASDSVVEADESPRPVKKQRRQRPSHSCAECRRLKLKCDRQAPCSNCVRRHRVEHCTKIAANGVSIRTVVRDQTRLGKEALDVEVNQQSIQQGQPQHEDDLHQGQPHGQQVAAEQGLADVSSRPPTDCIGNTLSESHRVVLSDVQSAGVSRGSGSHGTLMLGKGGRSKYLGPTAGSEWLKDTETQFAPDSASVTRAPSPVNQPSAPLQSSQLGLGFAPIAFPFNTSGARTGIRDLLSYLPPREEALTLVESYYRYCAWHHDVAPKPAFQKTFDRVYTLSEGGSVSPRLDPQEIALVYIIMAQGTMFNIEMPYYDPSVEDWLYLSERALVEGNFLSNNMVVGLQTLHLMAHLHLQLDKGGRGDTAWPLWGLVMRLIQAMGMHRDGACWNLPQNVVEERRKVFWECNAADTFQAHCFSRPYVPSHFNLPHRLKPGRCAINPEHCDVAFPFEPPNSRGEKSYSILRFELSQLSILNMAMKVRKPPYAEVIALDLRLCEFEHNLPFSLRCRAALLAMPSRYPHFEAAVEESPEPSRRSMTISFQQSNLALNISETIINLHRPYYAKALYEEIDDRLRSVHAPSFMTVIERCAVILSIVSDIHRRFPAVSTRQWNFWYHTFGSALCLGTLVLRDPGNPMATFVLGQIDTAIELFTSLVQTANTPRYRRNLQWLTKLRARVSSKISTASIQANSQRPENAALASDRLTGAIRGDREDSEDVELLGWRTRLIERADHHNRHTIRTIPLPGSLNDGPDPTPRDAGFENAQSGGDTNLTNLDPTVPNVSFPWVTPDSTDGLLHDFWDPMLLQDIFGPTHE
ncbi:Zn(II)2Cys6 transcription factor [Aspergillus foveolatus]|uniref:Zn(II)2Cys6 transcription factor n=1 Tax=Aspergillus foveolatus TaxID=210207 RepID=UPI003CCD14E3